jgi:hypothetical protein
MKSVYTLSQVYPHNPSSTLRFSLGPFEGEDRDLALCLCDLARLGGIARG